MSDPRPEARPDEGEQADIDSLEALEARGDAPGLLARAKEARAQKDMAVCLACYEAAARLGSGEAHYAAALFYLSGQVVAQDTKRGTTHLRAAAEAGVLPARVYLGNLYELGIHYAADPEKADVWYRSAARAAGIADDMEEEERAKRLADLGCVRAYLELAGDESASEEERAAWAKKARALGYGLKVREEAAARASAPPPESFLATVPEAAVATKDAAKASRPAAPKTLEELEAQGTKKAALDKGAPADAKDAKKPEPKKPEPKKPEPKKPAGPSRFTPALGLRAFLLEVIFLATGVAAGWLGMEGARMLIASRGALPVIADQPERALAILVALVGVLPALLVYKARTFVAALGAAAVAAGVGFWLHGTPTGTWLASRALQVSGFAAAGFLAALLVFGFFGGAKPPKKPPKDL